MAMMTVKILGSGDAFGSGGRLQTCFHVTSGDNRILLDCGASSLIAMKSHGLAPADLDAVLITHLHGDHFGGLPFLLLEAYYYPRKKPLILAGPAGMESRIVEAMEVFYRNSSRLLKEMEISFVILEEKEPAAIGDFEITPYPVVHGSGPSFALRVEAQGRTLAYSGDSEWCENLLEAARGADLFLCECFYFGEAKGNHLSYPQILSGAESFDCRRLLLTHLGEEMLANRSKLELDCAEDGQEIVL